MEKEYDYNSLYPAYEKLKEDHELLKKFFYEVRNHSMEKSHRIDDLVDRIEAYEKADKEMFSLLQKQEQYKDFVFDQFEHTISILEAELANKERVIMTRDIELDSLRRQLKEQRERKWWAK